MVIFGVIDFKNLDFLKWGKKICYPASLVPNTFWKQAELSCLIPFRVGIFPQMSATV